MTIAFEHSIDLPQSPHQVFLILDDYKKVPLWLKRCEGVAKQGAGANKVGDKLRYAYCEAGRHGVMDGVITAQDEDSRLAYKYYDKMMQVTVEFRMEPTDTGTRLTHRIEITPNSFMAKLMAPMIRMKLPKQTVGAMESLRSLLATEYTAA
ncbi:MAG: SRPBCC family protein [Asticcacaulis sp.]|nr:SRPBCC family protein [Asticcacaulis sp.]